MNKSIKYNKQDKSWTVIGYVGFTKIPVTLDWFYKPSEAVSFFLSEAL